MAENLGELLRAKRVREGLNLREAAVSSGISFSTLARIESGKPASLKVDRLARAWLDGEAPLLPTPPMTLRDWFAGQALDAVIRTCAGDTEARKVGPEPYFATKAYQLADAMLSERKRAS